MRTLLHGVVCAALTSVVVLSVPTAAEAAKPTQLCRTNSAAKLYNSPTSWLWVIPKGSLVRILHYRGAQHYLVRYDGKVGQIERKRIIQTSCYYQ